MWAIDSNQQDDARCHLALVLLAETASGFTLLNERTALTYSCAHQADHHALKKNVAYHRSTKSGKVSALHIDRGDEDWHRPRCPHHMREATKAVNKLRPAGAEAAAAIEPVAFASSRRKKPPDESAIKQPTLDVNISCRSRAIWVDNQLPARRWD